VAGLPFAIPRVGEEAIHESLVGVAARIGHERRHVGRLRRHAEQIEEQPPHERLAVGLGHGLDPLLRERREDKGVDG